MKRTRDHLRDLEDTGMTSPGEEEKHEMVSRFGVMSVSPRLMKKVKRVHAETEEKKKLYSYKEISAIVERILERKYASLAEEFEVMLNQGYREQFHQFTRFNQDNISSQVREGELSYLM